MKQNEDGSYNIQIDGVPFKAWLSNGHWYSFCANCGKWIRLDKPIIGSLHFC